MSMLSGFTAFNFNEGVPYVSITPNGVTFNKSVVMKMEYPEYVVLLIDENSKRIAIQVCDESTPNAVRFYKSKASGVISVRWNGKDLLNTIEAMMGWNLKETPYKADGILLKEEHAMIFDLRQSTIIT